MRASSREWGGRDGAAGPGKLGVSDAIRAAHSPYCVPFWADTIEAPDKETLVCRSGCSATRCGVSLVCRPTTDGDDTVCVRTSMACA